MSDANRASKSGDWFVRCSEVSMFSSLRCLLDHCLFPGRGASTERRVSWNSSGRSWRTVCASAV